MNVLRYGLMGFLVFGSFHKQYTSVKPLTSTRVSTQPIMGIASQAAAYSKKVSATTAFDELVDDDQTVAPYKDNSSAKGKKVGAVVSIDGLVDKDLGYVEKIEKDLSRIWVDIYKRRYRLSSNSFDILGNLTAEARKRLETSLNMYKKSIESQKTTARTVGKEPEDAMVVAQSLPLEDRSLKFFMPYIDGDRPVITREFVLKLESISDDQLIILFEATSFMPKPVDIISDQQLSIEELKDIFHGTIDLAGTIATDFFDRFFNVRCDNAETLHLYTEWLKHRFVPSISECILRNKKAVEEHYFKIRDEKIQKEVTQRENDSRELAVINNDRFRNTIKGGLSVGNFGILAPMVVHYSSDLVKVPVVRKVLYGACMVLAVAELNVIAGKMFRLTEQKNRLEDLIANSNRNSDQLKALPQKMDDESITMFNGKLGAFVAAMFSQIAVLTREESVRIERELRDMRVAEQAVLPHQDHPVVVAPIPAATAVPGVGSGAPSRFRVVFDGIVRITKKIGQG